MTLAPTAGSHRQLTLKHYLQKNQNTNKQCKHTHLSVCVCVCLARRLRLSALPAPLAAYFKTLPNVSHQKWIWHLAQIWDRL